MDLTVREDKIGEGAEIPSSAFLFILAPSQSAFMLLSLPAHPYLSLTLSQIYCSILRCVFPKKQKHLPGMMAPGKKILLFTWLHRKHHLFPSNRFFF